MKSTIRTLVLLSASVLTAGCFRNDTRIESFEIQQLRSPESTAFLTRALRGADGVKEIRSDIETRTLTVKFDGRTTHLKNIEHAISKAGFDLPNRPADPADKLKLPEELR